MRKRILVATDLSAGSDEAIVQGAARAVRDQADLTLVYVASLLFCEQGQDKAHHRRTELVAVESAIERRVSELTGRAPGSFEIRIETGPPHAVLCRLAIEQHALLVVGCSSVHPQRPAFFGGVAENIAAFGGTPLLVARPRHRGTCVLCVVGSSPSYDDALDTALEEAKLAHKRLVLLHCLNTEFLSQRTTDLSVVERRGRAWSTSSLLSLHARQRLSWDLRRRNVTADLRVVDGDPAYLVPLFARSLAAETLIIGAPESASLAAKVTTKVLREAPCPVLVAMRKTTQECLRHAHVN
ncbi:MAG: universal stress protein [Pseudomonadota bacterium]